MRRSHKKNNEVLMVSEELDISSPTVVHELVKDTSPPKSRVERKPRLSRGRVGQGTTAPSASHSFPEELPSAVSSLEEVSPLPRKAMFEYSDLSREAPKEEWVPRPRKTSDVSMAEEISSSSEADSRDGRGTSHHLAQPDHASKEVSSVAFVRTSLAAKLGENSETGAQGRDLRRNENPRRFSTASANPRQYTGGNPNGIPHRPNGDMRRSPNIARTNNGSRTLRIGNFSLGGLRNLDIFRRREYLENFFVSAFQENGEIFDLIQAYAQTQVQLLKFVEESALISGENMPSRSRILDVCMMHALEEGTPIQVKGVLEALDNGDGAIVYTKDSFRIQAKSAFVPRCLVQYYGLRRGQNITAYIHPPKEQSSCPFVLRIIDIMGMPADRLQALPKFKELTPCYPTERLLLESSEAVAWDNLSMRVVDLLTPIGLGQRGLIVAPPRTGKTILLQYIANAIVKARPDVYVMILLIDERPEEVTDFARHVPAEVISSTFDESAENHVSVADMAIENARRRVEAGQHVVILLDSITRLARAYNTRQPSSGKILSGGVEANALQEPKCFFGSARNIEGGGSLTILATALVETGSRMDDVIFEEFKGTGNMELHLDRALVEKRIFPAINFDKSGTRREELLYHPDEMEKIYTLRRALKGVPPTEAMEMLISRLKKTRSNVEFLLSVNR
ncbi:MAG: transcription termination factor Rho [Puniceicoccales bacterium]|nr:transcription termination factor Rho [Puniceicoccales bacterium]